MNKDELTSLIQTRFKHNCDCADSSQFYMGKWDKGYRGYLNVNWKEGTAMAYDVNKKPRRMTFSCLQENFDRIADDISYSVSKANLEFAS